MKCPVCNKEFKNQGAVNLHMRTHKAKSCKKEETKTDKRYVIELYNKETNVLVLSYDVIGEKELEEAKLNAERKDYRIEIS